MPSQRQPSAAFLRPFNAMSFFSRLSDLASVAVAKVSEAAAGAAAALNLDALQDEGAARRERYEGLDLTYLTPHLAVMPFPTYPNSRTRTRNDAGAVAALLLERHGAQAMIWNLSEEAHDGALWGGRVIEVRFPGHPVPPLDTIFRICSSVQAWLDAAPGNTAVLHCMTGRGRTAAVAACVLAWLGEFSSPLSALTYVCERRAADISALRDRDRRTVATADLTAGALAASASSSRSTCSTTLSTAPATPAVTATPVANTASFTGYSASSAVAALVSPSQLRYVQYFALALDGVKPRSGAAAPLILRRVVAFGVPVLARMPPSSVHEEVLLSTATSSDATREAGMAAGGGLQGLTSALTEELREVGAAAKSFLGGLRESTTGEGQSSSILSAAALPVATAGYRPSLQVFRGGRLVHSSAWDNGNGGTASVDDGWVSVEDGAAKFTMDVPLSGDVLIRCRHMGTSPGERETIWRAAFHTGYITACSLRLSKRQLDMACDDARVSEDAFVEFFFAPLSEVASAAAVEGGITLAATDTAAMDKSGAAVDEFWQLIAERRHALLARAKAALTPGAVLGSDLEPALSGAGPSLEAIIRSTPPPAAKLPTVVDAAVGRESATAAMTIAAVTAAAAATAAAVVAAAPGSGVVGAGASAAFAQDMADLEELERELGISERGAAVPMLIEPTASTEAAVSDAAPTAASATATVAAASSSASATVAAPAAAASIDASDDVVDELERYLASQ